MAYNALIPLATDSLSQSQADIYGNFNYLNTYFSATNDHEPFNSGALDGKHQKVTFPIAPAPAVVGAGFIGMYAKLDAANNPQLYINNPVPGAQIPFTAAAKASPGWTYLPSGIIMKWGTGTVGQNTDFTVNFIAGVGIPVFNAAPVCTVSMQFVAGMTSGIYISDAVGAITTTHLIVHNASNHGPATFYYIAIGY